VSVRAIKPVVFIGALVPAGMLVWGALHDDLGANPIEAITHETGVWGLRFLLATLAITPVRRLTGWNELIRFRRMIGLFAFFYACLHFATYIVLDLFFAFDQIAGDIARRPFITVGFTAFLLLIPLALTSTAAMIRRLGRKWQVLHRLVYVSAALVVVHYLWLVKADIQRPLIYGAVLASLLAARVLLWFLRPGATASPGRSIPRREPRASIPSG
jgi:sulfoxide reductase heme-binding subunit YedZ